MAGVPATRPPISSVNTRKFFSKVGRAALPVSAPASVCDEVLKPPADEDYKISHDRD